MSRSNIRFNSPKNDTAPILKIQNIFANDQHRLRVSFNFSFITTNNDFNLNGTNFTGKKAKLLFDRISFLSQFDVKDAIAKGKKHGLELIKSFSNKDKISKLDIHSAFGEDRVDLCNDGYWIFRLCPNNNPYESRILGKMIDHTFYVMFIDCEHELYAKRK